MPVVDKIENGVYDRYELNASVTLRWSHNGLSLIKVDGSRYEAKNLAMNDTSQFWNTYLSVAGYIENYYELKEKHDEQRNKTSADTSVSNG